MRASDFLHKGLILRSDKQNSAQGSVFYVKKEGDNQEFVLKVVRIASPLGGSVCDYSD